MRILFVTPELAPWSKAGGLGDATVALGKALAAMGHEVRAVTPLYGSVPGREKMGTLIESLKVGVNGDPRKAGCRMRTLTVSPNFEAWFVEHRKVIRRTKCTHQMYKKLKSYLNSDMVHEMFHTYRI